MPVPVEKPGFAANAAIDADARTDGHAGDSPAGVILHDLPCRTCGYNLRGLAEGGRCPECDTPIDRSTRGDLLRHCDPRWVRTLARGMRIINHSVILGLLAIIGLAIFAPSLRLPWIAPASVLLVGAVMAVGVWLATEREPAAADIERMFSSRRALRVLVVGAIVLQAAGGMLVTVSRTGALATKLAAAVIIIGGLYAAFRYAVQLARRIPDPLLAAQTRGVMWGLIISYGLFLMIAALALSNRPMPPALALVFGLSCTVFIGCIIFTLWTLALITRYALRLGEAAVESELSWAIDAEKADAIDREQRSF